MELSSSSYSALKEAGYIPLIFNVEDPSIGIQFNPLSLAIKNFLSGNKDDAELLCNSFAYSIYAKKVITTIMIVTMISSYLMQHTHYLHL